MKQPIPLSSIHYRYIIFILSLIVISLLTFKYAPETSLFNYVAFAATISSLILAILAIIQGFISSDSLSNTESNINESSNKIIQNSIQLGEIIASLDKKVEEIPILLKGIDYKLNITTDFLNPRDNKKSSKEIKISKEVFDNLIKTASASGILFLYTVVLGFKSQKPFNLSKINYVPYEITSDYYYAFIVACHCMSLINIKSTVTYEVEVLQIDDHLNNSKDLIDTFTSTEGGAIHKDNLSKAKISIDSYFSTLI